MENINLGERFVRDKNEITLPLKVREYLNLCPGDMVRFENNSGIVCIHKVVTRKINNNNGGGNGA